MFSGWPRTMQVGGFFGLWRRACCFASLSSSQVDPQPTFAAPPVYSVAGSEVGITGLTSMAKGDFNTDGILDFAAGGFAYAATVTILNVR